MPLIIDGYNLLHAAGIIPSGTGAGSLQRSRQALLNFLVESLDAKELARSVVVFDARQAPPGLARSITHRGLAVRFAAPDGDADRVIEELILRHSTPRRLTVVSSDHRLQNAARRRGATGVDSDVWFAQLVRKRSRRAAAPDVPAAAAQLTSEEVAYWMREFYGVESPTDVEAPAEPPQAPSSDQTDGPRALDVDEPIFPPGYAEDVFDDE